MKRLVVLTITFLFALPVRSQDNRPEDVIIDMFDAMADLNLDKMKSYWTRDMILIENGKLWNMDTLIQKLEPRKSDSTFSRVNRIEFIDSKVSGNIAYLCYNNQATVTSKARFFRIKWIENAVLYREGSEWKIHFLHSTLLERSSQN